MRQKELVSLIRESIIKEMGRDKKIPYYDKVSLVNDPKCRQGKDWVKYGGNFPIERNGKIYYISPSVVVSMKAFCKNNEGEWCILANQRGTGAPSNVGGWNTPCGYLDYGESVEDAAVRETFEESGVKIPKSNIRFIGKESGGSKVVMRFGAVLDGTIDDYPLSDQYSEPNELADIQWIPLSQVKNYKWNWKAQIYHAKIVLGNNFDRRSRDDIANELFQEIQDNPKAVELLKELLNF